jgi:hypothetical protein
MKAYYNEIDPLKAETIREAIRAGAIAPGDVDERSIADVQPSDLVGYTQCHFFAGGGFWSLALRQAGWPDDRPVWTGSCPCPSFSAAGNPDRAMDNKSRLEDQVFLSVTTPSARDWKDTSGMSESGVDPDGSTRTRLDQLPRQAQLAASGPTATGGTGATASTGQLDPAYSRWLMGVPPEWDGFACTATRSVSQRRRSSSMHAGKRSGSTGS